MKYSWEEVKEAANVCLRKLNPNMSIQDPVGQIYKNRLPEAIKDVALLFFVEPSLFEGTDAQIQMLREAQKQLDAEGLIGIGHGRQHRVSKN